MENIRTRQLHRWFWPVVAVMGYLLAAATGMWAQGNKPTDYQVKAAYLYNFGRFIEWPPAVTARTDAFNVCILGQDPFGKNLDTTLVGESIAGKHVVPKRISNAQESADCQILFLSSEEAGHMKQIIDALDKEAILTVSDIPKFSQRGGMIQFVLEGNRIRFEVNLTATQHAGLVLSSELLKVAAAVRKDSVTGD